MKKVLITGAAGFLGSHLCDRFINEGFKVIGMEKTFNYFKSLSQEELYKRDHKDFTNHIKK